MSRGTLWALSICDECSADFLCRKTRGILLGGLKNSSKMLGSLWALLICEECLVVPYEMLGSLWALLICEECRRGQKLEKHARFPMGFAHL